MTENSVKRKLRAILSADVKGYSRMMGEDEVGTYQTLTANLESIRSIISEYDGRVFSSPGDAVMAEFSSVVDAVQCAVKIQGKIEAANSEAPEDSKMQFRIGVNVGDVIQDGEQVYGDGVNIAARIETLAEPGGVSISRNVYNQVRNKLKFGYEYQGGHQVKNISDPVKIYKVLMDPEDAGKLVGEEPAPAASNWIWPTVVMASIFLTLIGYQVYQNFSAPEIEPASVENMAYPLPNKPSIAVLPFENMSEDKDYLSDGFTETIIATLAQSPELFVIDRTSVFTYKARPAKVKQVAQDLGIQYVLEGSVQRSGDRIRVTAQLIDALDGRHVWADQYDRSVENFFAVQAEISRKVFIETHVSLAKGEHERVASRGTKNLDALLLRMKGLAEGNKFTKEGMLKARELYGAAAEVDPKYARAWAGLSWSYWYEAMMGGWTMSRDEALQKAINFAEHAVEVNPQDPSGYQFLGNCMSLKGEHDRAVAFCKKAVELAPSDFQANGALGTTLMWAEDPKLGLEYLEHAKRLSPRYPAWVDMLTGFAQLMVGNNEEAVMSLRQGVDRSPNTSLSRGRLIAALVAAGHLDEAKKEAVELLKFMPDFTVPAYVKTHRFKDPARREWLSSLLLQAGLPESPQLRLPDKPSIAILPFENMSGDPEQEYFSDGITEDIITALSKTPKLFVIARNSTFTYKGKAVNVQEVGQDLGVRYVLKGSVRRFGEKVRINAQLIDAKTGHHLWAEKYDRDLEEIFAVQDDLTKRIITAMQVELTEGEQARVAAKGTNNLEAYLKFLQAYNYANQLNIESNAMGRQLALEAIELDPQYAMAYRVLATTYLMDVLFGMSKSPKQSYATRIKLLQKVIELDDSYAEAYGALGFTYSMIGKHDKAVELAEQGVSLNPNSANTHLMLAHTFRFSDRPEEAIPEYKKAIRLNPIPPALYFFGLGMSFSLVGQYGEAIKWCEKAVRQEPDNLFAHLALTAAYSMSGREKDARAEATEVLRLNPKYSLDKAEKRSKIKYKDKWFEALRKAGLK